MTARSVQPGNLPAEVTAFVGRRHLLDVVTPALVESRLVTLVGVGGVGKTRAAVRLGKVHARTSPGGVWLVDLATVDDAELVARTVAAALGIHDQSQRPAVATVVDRLREREPMLLVLDNCEHLTAAVAEVADALLRQAPDVRMLATSRQPLGVPGEHVVRVRAMSMPRRNEARTCTSLDAIVHHDAVRLFVDRAADAGVRITDHDARSVARLVRRLEGVPLSIELAAARTPMMSVADILDRMNDPLHILAGTSSVSHPEHHHDLDATLAWSYHLCSPDEQRLWSRLAIFTGGFDLVAAEAICADDMIGTSEVLALIGGLIRQSLLTVDRNYDRTPSRYRMLETVRAYGLARLTEYGELDNVRRRHRDYYRALTDALVQDWYSPRERDWMNRIRQDMPNIRAALSNAVTVHDTETGLNTTLNLCRSRVWFLFGTLPEARYWLRTLLGQDPDTHLRLRILATGAWITACQGDNGSALSIVADCMRTARCQPTNDSFSLSLVALAKGTYQLFCGDDFAAAVANLTTARHGLLGVGLLNDVHMVRLCLTIAAAADADPVAAFAAAEDCLHHAEAAGAGWAISWANWAYGLVHLRHGDARRARTLIRIGLRAQRDAVDNWGPAWSISSLGWTAAALGEHEHAAELLGAAHRQLQRIGIDTAGLKLLSYLGASAQAASRDKLGADSYNAAYQRGFTLDDEAAAAMALTGESSDQRLDGYSPPRPRPPLSQGIVTEELTHRELEVAQLLAGEAGLTNREIAARLYISVRTVDTHMNHIMRKLGATSRAQIAVWASATASCPDGPQLRQ